MRQSSMVIVAAVVGAGAATMLQGFAGAGAVAQGGSQTAPVVRVATVDPFQLIEKMMTAPEPTDARARAVAGTDEKLRTLESELQQIDTRLQGAKPGDAGAQELVTRAQAAQQEYQQLQAQRQADLEKINSAQLIETYGKVTKAATKIAVDRGYTHVIASRSPDRALTTPSVASTLQELLARPVIKSVPGDDLTAAVAAELGIKAEEVTK